MKQQPDVKPICFYLPQFHQIAENDRWWGEGFTEWSLVRAARPLFNGHAHPVIPDDSLGYYDATEIGTRRRQAELAKQYGIYGFCYYHYWFNGKRLLEKPLEKMLEDGEPDLPFCLCWANEPWSRRWSGEEQNVLQAQDYGEQQDWQDHFNELKRFFNHKNYICVEGRPVFLIYRIGHIPEARNMIAYWRHLAVEIGLPGLHIVAVEGSFPDNKVAPNFVDATVAHQPSSVLDKCHPLAMNGLKVYSIEEIWQCSILKKPSHPVHYPGVCHAWDNTPRRGRDGCVVLASRPDRFRQYLRRVFTGVRASEQAPYVFVNAWNEWSEGAHLEPESLHGDSWLACIKAALTETQVNTPAPVSLMVDSYAAPCPARFVDRPRTDPDPDLIFTVIQHKVKASCVVDFGCAKALSSEHIKYYTGADRYLGLEPDPAWVTMAKARLDEVIRVDAENPLMHWQGDIEADFIVCSELLGRVNDPVSVLTQLRTLLATDGLICLGFEDSASDSSIYDAFGPTGTLQNQRDGLTRGFNLQQARAMLLTTGFRIEKLYRVFHPVLSRLESLLAQGKQLQVGELQLQNLSRSELENLFSLRFFMFARPNPAFFPEKSEVSADSKGMPKTDDGNLSYAEILPRLNLTISAQDSLYPVYRESNQADEYFESAFRQLREVDGLLEKHCATRLSALDSVADYACHYGRLLRVMRAIMPEAELLAYDIDKDAIAFCQEQFSCVPGLVGWNDDLRQITPRHQLLICASLLTHTDIEYYRQALAVWSRMIFPGGLICFTYLGDQYVSKWLSGELDHYGPVSAQNRELTAQTYRQQGHALAGFDSPYSEKQKYGVGFISETTVISELAKYPQLEYLGTVTGDVSEFNQDLAVVRKMSGAC
jgi:trans-aconitate methyltransferase